MSVTTLVEPSASTLPAAIPQDLVFRLSVQQYHEMIQAGIITDDDKVELLEGWLIAKMSKNPPHRITTKLVRDALTAIAPAGWYVDSQEPITLEDSEPEPDVTVIRGETRNYADQHPGVDDVALVVEISDSTLDRDQVTKKRIYARAGVKVYWIINLIERRCEVYTEPGGKPAAPDYQQRADYNEADRVPVVIDGTEAGAIKVSDLLP